MQVKNIAKVVIFGAALASTSAMAEFDWDGVYVLGGVGYGGVEDAKYTDNNSHNFDGSELGGTTGFSKEAGGNFGWRGGIGAWLTDHFALELNYFGLSDMESDSDHFAFAGTPDPINAADGHFHEKTSGMYWIDVSALGRCYFMDNFWGFARLGLAWAKVDRREYFEGDATVDGVAYTDLDVEVARQDTGGMGAALGIGGQYDFTPMLGARVEVNTVQALNNNDLYMVTGALVLNFGELM